jgi:hypothetical protein
MDNYIVGLCQDAKEGVHLHHVLSERHKNTPIFCVFHGPSDRLAESTIPREKRFHLPPGSGEEAAIRAALMWIPRMDMNFENVAFCYAEQIPEIGEIEEVLDQVDQSGMQHATESCWGLSLTWAALHGWGRELRCEYRPPTDAEHLLAMGMAMRGEPVDTSALARATVEVMPERIQINPNTPNAHCAEFVQRVASLQKSLSTSRITGRLMSQENAPNASLLAMHIDVLKPGEMVGVVCHQDVDVMLAQYAPYRPHRILRGTRGLSVLLFSKNSLNAEQTAAPQIITETAVKAGIVNANGNVYTEESLGGNILS